MNGNNFFIIDVGNTDIVIALIKDFQIYKIKRYKTIDFRNKKLLLFKKFTQIKKILSKQNKINCIISSVVPEINYNLKKTCISFLKENPHFVSFNKTKLNIKINLKNKNQVGADRIANTIAVKSLYKKAPTLVIDFGTATTFDVIDNSSSYVGGLIAPGINLSLQNLFNKTSKLPLVKFKKNDGIIGKNTRNAIQNGLYLGYIGLVTFIIKKIQTKFKKKLFCISTGGLSKIISKDIKLINVVNENLTTHGLIEIFKLNYNEKFT